VRAHPPAPFGDDNELVTCAPLAAPTLGFVVLGYDRLRSRTARGVSARCLPALVVGAGVLSVAGCGGGSHAAGTTAAADVNGAAVGAGTSATTTGTSTTSAAPSGTSTTGTTSATTAAGGQGQGNGASGGGSAATGGAVKNGPNDPASSHGGSSGRPAAHGKAKAVGKTVAAGGAGAAGSGAGSGSSGAAGSSPNSGAGVPNANTGIPFEVETSSMEPTYQPETKIYYDPTRTHPQVGEVIVFYLPAGAEEGACGTAMVGGRACSEPVPGQTKSKLTSFKRVVGLPGDSIAIHEGHVIRNGQQESEPPILPCGKDEKVECEFPTPITVPAGHYYVMADNRGLPKEDSRIFGAVPQEYILGTVEGG